MTNDKPKCIFCERTSQEIPLVPVHFQDNQYWICPEHLPYLIHHPDKLAGLFPGADRLKPYED